MASEQARAARRHLASGRTIDSLPGFDGSISALVDGTGGTASDTAVANLANGTTYATDHPTIENNFATLTAKVNEILALLQSAGLRD